MGAEKRVVHDRDGWEVSVEIEGGEVALSITEPSGDYQRADLSLEAWETLTSTRVDRLRSVEVAALIQRYDLATTEYQADVDKEDAGGRPDRVQYVYDDEMEDIAASLVKLLRTA